MKIKLAPTNQNQTIYVMLSYSCINAT